MIDEVVSLRPELETATVVDQELFVKTDIPVLKAGLVNRVAHTVLRVKRPRCGRRENRLPAGVRRREVFRRIRITGRSGETTCHGRIAVHHPELTFVTTAEAPNLAHLRIVGVRADTARRPGLKLRDTVDFPAAQKLSGEARV